MAQRRSCGCVYNAEDRVCKYRSTDIRRQEMGRLEGKRATLIHDPAAGQLTLSFNFRYRS